MYYTSQLMYWLRAIKAVFPDTYKTIPVEARVLFSQTDMACGSVEIGENTGYEFLPGHDYLVLKFVAVNEIGNPVSAYPKHKGFDLSVLQKCFVAKIKCRR